MSLALRIAAPRDAERVLPLMQAYFAYDEITFDGPSVRRGLAELLANREIGWVFLAENEGDVVAYAIATAGFDLEFGGRKATLTDLYVVPSGRRSGLGRRLLKFVEETCVAAHVRAIELQVESDNPEAEALYLASGFKTHTRKPMSKRLSP